MSALSRTPRQWLIAMALAAPLAMLWVTYNEPTRRLLSPGSHLGHFGTWLVIALGLVLATRVGSRLVWAWAAVLALAMAVMRLAGSHYTPREEHPFRALAWHWPVELLVDWAVLLIGSVVALGALSRVRRPVGLRQGLRSTWMVAVLVQLICWLPYYLIYFPGILGRDSWSSIIQGTGLQPLSNHHPVLFTLWVGWCMDAAGWFGAGTTVGVAIFAAVQAIFLSAGLGLVVTWMRSRFGRWPALATLAFCALDPSIALWSISMHKDTPFVLWMTLLTVLLAEGSFRGLDYLARPRQLVALGGLLLATSFSRNNGPYIVMAVVLVLTLLVLAGMFKRRPIGTTWRLPVVGVVVIAITLGIQGPGYERWGVIPSSTAESAGLQLHQIGWAVTYGTITAEQADLVEQIIPVARLRQIYEPSIVDAVKFDPAFNKRWLEAHPEEFRALWLDVMRTNPGSYARAWYALSGGYLDVDRVIFRMDPGTKRGKGPINVDDHDLLGPRVGAHDAPKRLPVAAAWVATTPLINLSYSLALLFWACLLACCAALLRRRPTAVLAYVPFLALVATLLIAAPVTDYRYVAAGHVGFPVLVAMLWAGPRPPRRLPGLQPRIAESQDALSLTDGRPTTEG